MSNVWIKSGTVRNMFPQNDRTTPPTNTQTANGTSQWVYKDSPHATFQATVTGTGAVTGTFVIEVSNDGVNPATTPAGTITLTGTAPVSDGFVTQNSPWKYVRCTLSNLTGTGAAAQVYMGV
jgi:hypothetical protein